MDTLRKEVLVSNRHGQAVNIITVQSAFSMMASDAATSIVEGHFLPVRWRDWIELAVRDQDEVVPHALSQRSSAQGHHSYEVR
jgi:hypothetical protein